MAKKEIEKAKNVQDRNSCMKATLFQVKEKQDAKEKDSEKEKELTDNEQNSGILKKDDTSPDTNVKLS